MSWKMYKTWTQFLWKAKRNLYRIYEMMTLPITSNHHISIFWVFLHIFGMVVKLESPKLFHKLITASASRYSIANSPKRAWLEIPDTVFRFEDWSYLQNWLSDQKCQITEGRKSQATDFSQANHLLAVKWTLR